MRSGYSYDAMLAGVLSIAVSLLLIGCDSGKLEKEYLKAVHADYATVQKNELPALDKLGDSQVGARQQFDQLSTSVKQLEELKVKVIEAQARRKALAVNLKNEEVKKLDGELEAFYGEFNKAVESAIPFLTCMKSIINTMDHFSAAMDAVNTAGEDKEAVARAFQDLKGAFVLAARELEGIEIPTGKTALKEMRDITVAEFKKPIPIIEDMTNALAKNSAAKIELAGQKFEKWGQQFDQTYQTKVDSAMQPEISALEATWKKIETQSGELTTKIARLEGQFGISSD
jgi:hypothetical protein